MARWSRESWRDPTWNRSCGSWRPRIGCRRTSWGSTMPGSGSRSRRGSSRRSRRASAVPRSSSRSIRPRTASRSSGLGWRRRASDATHRPSARNPRPIDSVADVAGQAVHTTGPSVEHRIDPAVVPQSQADAGDRHLDRADGAQGRPRLRIEALEGLRKTPVSFPPDRPQQVLRSVRVRGLDFLDRPIEVAEDPADLYLAEMEARGPEGTNRFAGRLTKFLGAETIRGLQVWFDHGLRKRHQPGVRHGRIHLPCGAGGRRDRDEVEPLSFLVGHKGDTEGQQEEDRLSEFGRLEVDARLGPQTCFGQGAFDPLRAGGLEPCDVPSAAGGREGHDPLEEVAARGDELRLEIPRPFGIEGDREGRWDSEIGPNAFRNLNPGQRIGLRHGRADVGEGVENEPSQRLRVAHAGTSSLTSRSTSSFRSRITSY